MIGVAAVIVSRRIIRTVTAKEPTVIVPCWIVGAWTVPDAAAVAGRTGAGFLRDPRTGELER